eukprot:s2156_g11.t1
MATIWDAGSSFAEEVCAGAVLHARRIGMTVLDATGIADQAMMPHMRELKGMGPDLLVGCFVPLGLILTAVSSRDAVRSVGAHLANYVMSPLVWEPSKSVKCPIFGSAWDFAAAYREEFNEETYALPESAAAAAGAIALLSAIQVVSSLEQSEVRQALLSRSVQTCYGLLSFDKNGTRSNAHTLTQQVQPLGKDPPHWDQATMDRWISADIVTLGSEGGQETLSGWPLPTWVQKEIDVYPCVPGEAVVLDNGGNATTCKKCPPGRYRTPRSVECEDCFYRLPAASQSGTFVPRLPRLEVECTPPELCLGKNECKEAHQGILCQHCGPGYSLPLWGLKREFCRECPSHRVAASSIALTVFLYVLYIWLIVKGTRSASQSVRAIHSVILKIGVNYLQFAGTAFEATEFKVMVATICGESGSYLMPFIAVPERLQYPFSALISLDCILPSGSSIRPYQVEIAVGQDASPPVSPQRRGGDFTPVNKLCGPRGRFRLIPDNVAETNVEDVCAGGDFTPMSAYGLGSPWNRNRSEEDWIQIDLVFVNSVATRFVNSVIVMSFILHPVVVRILVVGFECEELDVLLADVSKFSLYNLTSLQTGLQRGVQVRQSHALACLEHSWLNRVWPWSSSVPLHCAVQSSEVPVPLKYYYFESVYMFRKVMILLFFTAPTMYVRMVLMLFTSFGFILLHVNSGPFDNRSYMCLDRLEALSLTARALGDSALHRVLLSCQRMLHVMVHLLSPLCQEKPCVLS